MIPVGTRLDNFPTHNLGMFAQYVVPEGPLANLGATFGVTNNSARSGSMYDLRADGSSLIRLKPYAIFDAGLSYRIDGWAHPDQRRQPVRQALFPERGKA